MEKTIISIVVPVFNAEQWLSKCIESVREQTFKAFELILVDDDSSDRSREICAHYASVDERICSYHKMNGGGAGDARNYGIQRAKGQFIAFLDADDYYEPDMLETLYKAQRKSNADLVVCGYHRWDEKTGRMEDVGLEDVTIYGKDAVRDYFLRYYPDGIMGYPWNKLYRRNLIEKEGLHFPIMKRLEDGIFNVNYIQCVDSICVVNKPCICYRVNNQVLLKKLPYTFYNDMKTFSKNYYGFLKNEDVAYEVYEEAYIRYFLNDFVCCLENIIIGHWDNIRNKDKSEYLKKLRQEKLVNYMLRKKVAVPTYSSLVIKLFERRHFLWMRMVIRVKILMKKHFYSMFLKLKEKVN